MTSRIYVEKQPEFDSAAKRLVEELRGPVGVASLQNLRIVHVYDVSGLSDSAVEAALPTVFFEPAVEQVHSEFPAGADAVLSVQYLPGQFDQRAAGAESVLKVRTGEEEARVLTATSYLLYGDLSRTDLELIERQLVNPVDARVVDLTEPLRGVTEGKQDDGTPIVEGFISSSADQLEQLREQWGLAMDAEDLEFTRAHFESERRDPTETELRVIDTYWSDHCRHTTFLTELTDIHFEDPRAEATFQQYLQVRKRLKRTKPISLMDLGTIAAKHLRTSGKLDGLDVSEEINACTVKVSVDVDGREEPWLLLFKNETHNHPTEIEPFGGAGTCLGGAIRDPLSGRSYVYQAMRVTGAADPRAPLAKTLPGKLPQRQIVNQAADGYASYGNQIGLPAGLVEEIYHPGYVAKRMEVGAVVGAAPAKNVVREVPAPGDKIVLLGGKTGRDGCGGATGSSKTHTEESVLQAGPEVQKGSAPEERKIQRLFRDPAAAKLIKRSNDFGAGGVSVAIGELAPGLEVDLDSVPVKYAGLTGTELAISESQERMAVVLAPDDVEEFLQLAAAENIEATVVAEVTAKPRLVIRHRGQKIVDLPREFLDSNGTAKQAAVTVAAPKAITFPYADDSLVAALTSLAGDINIASQRGLVERFDATAGGGTVLMPLGGKYQLTPIQAMAARIPVTSGATSTASVMSYGFNPAVLESDPYAGAYLAVVESLAKLVATGASLDDAYLSFQEYFPRLQNDPARWGQPAAALLGALKAQLDFGVAAVGGKDSMSGTFEDLDVPPTLISFAITTANADDLISPEFRKAGSRIAVLSPVIGNDGLPTAASLKDLWGKTLAGIRSGEVLSAWTPGVGGVAEGILKMAVGNRIGAALHEHAPLFKYNYGAMLLETAPDSSLGVTIGNTTATFEFARGRDSVSLDELQAAWTESLEDTFPTRAPSEAAAPTLSYTGRKSSAAPTVRNNFAPRFLIPVFPGTSGDFEAARAVQNAGGEAEIFVVKDLTGADIARSGEEFAARLQDSQALFLPGGFAAGDEPGGAGKYVAAFLRREEVAAQLEAMLDERGALVAGIGNGFQALIKLGLLPFGRIIDPAVDAPALTENLIGRHQSRIVRTRVSSTMSPWFANTHVGQVVNVALSAGEARFVASEDQLEELAARGQIAAQYVGLSGHASMEVDDNPAGSTWAVEALTSPDGRVLGKMGHSERMGKGLHLNVPGPHDLGMFSAAVKYLRS